VVFVLNFPFESTTADSFSKYNLTWEELKTITDKLNRNDCAFIAESYFITIKK